MSLVQFLETASKAAFKGCLFFCITRNHAGDDKQKMPFFRGFAYSVSKKPEKSLFLLITTRGTTVDNDKQALRKKLLAEITQSPGPDPELIAERIWSLKEYGDSEVVLAFIPLKSEPDITMFIDRAVGDGKEVIVPDTEIGTFKSVGKGWREHIVTLPNNTQSTDSPLLKINDLKSRMSGVGKTKGIILVPGLAFTEFGTRLGRGAGYYDRLLDLISNSGSLDFIPIGICRQSQLLEDIPQQPHDRKVRMVIAF